MPKIFCKDKDDVRKAVICNDNIDPRQYIFDLESWKEIEDVTDILKSEGTSTVEISILLDTGVMIAFPTGKPSIKDMHDSYLAIGIEFRGVKEYDSKRIAEKVMRYFRKKYKFNYEIRFIRTEEDSKRLFDVVYSVLPIPVDGKDTGKFILWDIDKKVSITTL